MSDPKTVKIRIETEDEIQEYETTSAAIILKEEEDGFVSIVSHYGTNIELLELAKSLEIHSNQLKAKFTHGLIEDLFSDIEVKEDKATDGAEVIV